MLPWQAAFADLNHSIIATFPTAASFYPQGGDGSPISITGALTDPPSLEGFLPGSSQGTNIIHFLIYYPDVSPAVQKGDVIRINAISYDVADNPIDSGGGCVLKLRRNAQP